MVYGKRARRLAIHGDIRATIETHIGVGEKPLCVCRQLFIGWRGCVECPTPFFTQPRAQFFTADDFRDIVPIALTWKLISVTILPRCAVFIDKISAYYRNTIYPSLYTDN